MDDERGPQLNSGAKSWARPYAQVPKWLTILIMVAILVAVLARLSGCGGKDLSKETDAQLGLNAQQSAGRVVFETDCAACHYAYSSSGLKGPGLKKLFSKKYLPSGLPANDRFVEQTIVSGRGMMPGQGEALTDQQLADLMAYLHTL
jgi:mono/diheme cytochrome c family protein